MTEARYLPDADDVTSFEATITAITEDSIVLDGTYFYPEGGGQPADTGRIEWDDGTADIESVHNEAGEIHHRFASIDGERPAVGTRVRGQIDEQRRRRLSRMHTAQHVVSRIVFDEYEATTAGNQIHEHRSRIDFEPVSFDETDLAFIEDRANRVIDRDLSVRKENRPRDTVEQTVDTGRALLELIPDSVDPLRVVEIESFDLCPCGGTHVNSLGDIGDVSIVDRTSKGADTERIEFELR